MTNPPIYETKKIDNLKDMLNQSCLLFGNKDAFLLKQNDESYTGVKYTEFKTDVDALGTALLELGLKDKYIALISENRYEWCVTYLSTVNGTGIIVPLDKELPLAEIENLLFRASVVSVIFSNKFLKDLKEIQKGLPSLKYLINMDADEDSEGVLSFKKLLSRGKELIASGDRSFIDASIDETSMSMLLFTSGSTDLAKGVMLSHRNICFDIMSVCGYLHLDEKDSSLSILPLHHTYGCTTDLLIMLYKGCTISFNEGLKHIVKNLKETKPTLLFLVPLILESMYKKIWDQANKKPMTAFKLKTAMRVSDFLLNVLGVDIRKKLFKEIHETLGGRVRLVISGAAGINPEVSKGFHSMGIRLLQGYGLTECSPIVAVNTDKQFKHPSIGPALPGIEIRIDNPSTEGIGELVVKGENVMLGYFGNEKATNSVLKDGWLYTGDLCHMDVDGFLYITGRKKNVIVTKNGKNIFPEEVEAYLNKSPFILESLVWGKHDDNSDETYVNAQIVPAYDEIKQRLKLDEISVEDVRRILSNEIKAVNKSMPLYKRVRDFSIRDNEFAKTTTRKIKRYVEKTG